MRQHITVEQLEELNKEQIEKLSEALLKPYIYFDYKAIGCLQILARKITISKMIDILSKNASKELEIEVTIKIKNIASFEPCNMLWEAMKYILEDR